MHGRSGAVCERGDLATLSSSFREIRHGGGVVRLTCPRRLGPLFRCQVLEMHVTATAHDL